MKPPLPRRSVLVSNQTPGLRCDARAILAMIRCLDAADRFASPAGELSIALLTTEAMSALHDRFLGDPSPTDVITFAGDPSSGFAGEICVCPNVAHEYAEKRNRDFSAELALYIAHGYLHLCGHDDVEPADRRRMRTAERAAMTILRAADAVPPFRWVARNPSNAKPPPRR